MGFLDGIGDFLGLNKGKATVAAAKQNKGLLDELAPVGRDIIGGIQDTTGDYLDLGKLGASAYADAMGLNGADASAAARDKFTTSPGYEFSLDQGLQALERVGSKYGRANSGQTDMDLMNYGINTANNEWGDYLTRLGSYNDMYSGGVDKSNAAAGLGLDFETGLTSSYMGANNQKAAGKEAGQGAGLDMLSTLAGIGGNIFGGYGG